MIRYAQVKLHSWQDMIFITWKVYMKIGTYGIMAVVYYLHATVKETG